MTDIADLKAKMARLMSTEYIQRRLSRLEFGKKPVGKKAETEIEKPATAEKPEINSKKEPHFKKPKTKLANARLKELLDQTLAIERQLKA